jgi:hypothetical protein
VREPEVGSEDYPDKSAFTKDPPTCAWARPFEYDSAQLLRGSSLATDITIISGRSWQLQVIFYGSTKEKPSLPAQQHREDFMKEATLR